MHFSQLANHRVVLIRGTLSYWVTCSNVVYVPHFDFLWFQTTIGAHVDWLVDFIILFSWVIHVEL